MLLFLLAGLSRRRKPAGRDLANFSAKSAPYAPKTKPDKRLIALFREASPEDPAFLIKHAKFIIRRKK